MKVRWGVGTRERILINKFIYLGIPRLISGSPSHLHIIAFYRVLRVSITPPQQWEPLLTHSHCKSHHSPPPFQNNLRRLYGYCCGRAFSINSLSSSAFPSFLKEAGSIYYPLDCDPHTLFDHFN